MAGGLGGTGVSWPLALAILVAITASAYGGAFARTTLQPLLAKDPATAAGAHADHGTTELASTPAGAPVVPVVLGEFFIRPGKKTVAAGTVEFAVVNKGNVEHEFMVIKEQTLKSIDATDSAAMHDSVELSEHGITPGKAVSKAARLAPGRYVLLCNLPGHLASGQQTVLIVK